MITTLALQLINIMPLPRCVCRLYVAGLSVCPYICPFVPPVRPCELGYAAMKLSLTPSLFQVVCSINKKYPTIQIDELFVFYPQVLYEGAIIGAVVADSKVEALAAARKVKVTYENLPVIKTIKVSLIKS